MNAPSPYAGLNPRAYWRSGVAERADGDPGDLYQPRFPVTREMRIMTAGSCFAQHVGRALRRSGFNVIDAERLGRHIPDAVAERFGYRQYSARYGNLYTSRQLRQLLAEALGGRIPALPVWRRGDRFFDAQRPGVEPDGLDSEASVLAHRAAHLGCVRGAVRQADLFVFTFGLTEAWIHGETGTVYPTAPGTIAGEFDPEVFAFRNFDVTEVMADFEAARQRLKRINPEMRFLVTVSPVPLTATATGRHVEVATCYSKAVLRAACGMLTEKHEDVDYFPSFEIITSQTAGGRHYEDNLRNVTAEGVATAMGLFLGAHGVETQGEPTPGIAPAGTGRRRRPRRRQSQAEEVACEEALLEAFSR